MDDGMEQLLNQYPEEPVPVEETVIIKGIKNPVCCVILGFSTIKVIEEVLKLDKKILHVIVIEPSIPIFKQTLKRHFVGKYFKDKRFDFILGQKGPELRAEIYKLFAYSSPEVGARASTALVPEIIADPFVYGDAIESKIQERSGLIQDVIDASKQLFLSMGCSSDGFNRWEQTIRNKFNLMNCYKVNNLWGKFKNFPSLNREEIDKAYNGNEFENLKNLLNQTKDVPAIVLGAGPSMEDFIIQCKQHDLTNKAIVIACDAALKRLLKEGIRPHIVVRCERKLSHIFEGVEPKDTENIFYAAYPWTPPEFFDLFKDSFMLFRTNGVCIQTGLEHGLVNGGVSSANACLELAWMLGCKKIILSGIDLIMMDGKSHMDGTEVEFDINKSKEQGKWFDIKTNDGGMGTTIPVWYRCLGEYESSLKKYAETTGKDYVSNPTVYNTSLKGALINGTTISDWDSLIPLFDTNFDVINFIRSNLKKHDEKDIEKVVKQSDLNLELLKNAKKDLQKLFLFVDDSMINSLREEEKMIQQLKAHNSPEEFFKNIHNLRSSLVEVFTHSVREIDKFKSSYLTNKDFNDLIVDMCQLDLFQVENKCNSLENLQPTKHERLKTYIVLYYSLFKTFYYYIDQMICLMETGKAKMCVNQGL